MISSLGTKRDSLIAQPPVATYVADAVERACRSAPETVVVSTTKPPVSAPPLRPIERS